MGGMVGQWLGANAPDRVEKLILANTNFYYADKAPWADRIKTVRENGLDAHRRHRTWSAGSPRISASARRRPIARMTRDVRRHAISTAISPAVEAVRDMDFRESNPRITAPTLVIVGKQDPATPPVAGEAIAQQIKGAKVVALDAAHISNVEQPQGLHRRGARLPAQC